MLISKLSVKPNSKFVLLLIIVILFIFPTIAYASNYAVTGWQGEVKSYGTNGYNYVMNNPTITDQHVSSLYVYLNGLNGVEVGWAKKKDWSSAKFFGVSMDNGVYKEYPFNDAPAGTNHHYTVRNVTGTYKWRWYVDGTFETEKDLGFKYGYSLVASERNRTDETNYSHFWNLRYRDSQGNWYDWTKLVEESDNDPDYNLRVVSDTECFMEQ